MKKTLISLFCILLTIGINAQDKKQKEYKLYFTNFQDWEATSLPLGEPATKTVITNVTNEKLTFTWGATEINPSAKNGTADFVTHGYAKAAKANQTDGVAPYLRTTALGNISRVRFVHSATGSNRGWGLRMREKGQTEWVTISDSACLQAGTKMEIIINKKNVELEWYNLTPSQNAFLTELTIYGMAEDDGKPNEYSITYFDQHGKMIAQHIQNENESLTLHLSANDLTIDPEHKFRCWATADGTKIDNGYPVTDDMRLHAIVTPIETNDSTSRYIYNLTDKNFTPDDHECINTSNATFYNSNKGWFFNEHSILEVSVSQKAYIRIQSAQPLNSITKVTDTPGNTLSFYKDQDTIYETYYNGQPTTLTFLFSDTAYISTISIYNVQDEVKKNNAGWWQPAAGDANSLLVTLLKLKEGDKVFLANGVYDLGQTTLTPINSNKVSIIGESMDSTIIRNAPDIINEGISTTATLLINGNDVYLQDLTILNALDYYRTATGRAVTIQDKGTRTICKNIKLLSHQDTYYSNCPGATHYFEDCSIHGTVDYICGDGSVFFNRCELYCEKRDREDSYTPITASNASANDKGYVFYNCTVRSECKNVSLGRSWNNSPQCVFINTIFDYSAGYFTLTHKFTDRWTLQWMNAAPVRLGEYNTMDIHGNRISPDSHKIVFHYENQQTDPMETILSDEEAENLRYEHFFVDWDPAAIIQQMQTTIKHRALRQPTGFH